MIDEEQEWLKTQFLDRSPDHDMVMGSSSDVIDNESDGGDEDERDDDYVPGCYELDIGENPFLWRSKIWVRADYIRVYEAIESRYNFCYFSNTPQSVVLTGHPGTGECGRPICKHSHLSSTKEKLSACSMHYVGAVPKGSQLFGTMDLRLTCLWRTAYTKWLRTFKRITSRSLSGP